MKQNSSFISQSSKYSTRRQQKILDKHTQQMQKMDNNLRQRSSAFSFKDTKIEQPPKPREVDIEEQMEKNWAEGRRMRKNGDQVKVLQEYFKQNPTWSDALKRQIAADIGMTRHQVSKWNWDMRKKAGIPTPRLGKRKAGS